ncbi:MAG TPA: hypothetical protein VG942_18605 [Hyphomonadaceae bacterium]|nr:hypothetical protein [Hyphomonadaceae bacterium]
MRFLIALLALAGAMTFAPRADAAMMFGEQDNFKTLAKLTITQEQIDKDGLPKEWVGSPELVEHSTALFVLAGVWVTDKGYAIKPTTGDSYWDLDDSTVAGLQKLGVLPDPMPKHEMDIIDTIFGYSLYIVIAGLIVFYGLKAMFFSKPAAVAATPPAEAPTEQGGPRSGQ